MRFFQGTRDTGKKKVSASERYKMKMSGKEVKEKTPQEKYEAIIEAKMEKMMEDVIMGRKKSAPKIPGTKTAGPDEDAPPPVISKNAKLMLKMLAMQKLKKEEKKEKKKALQEMWSLKSKKKAEAFAKAAADAADYDKRQAEAAAAAAPTQSWTYGSTMGDDNNGW